MTAINGSNPNIDLNHYSLGPSQDAIAANFGGDAAAELAAMVFLFSRERSKDASENRNSLEQTIQAHQEIQVSKLHEAADQDFAAALVQGVTQIVSGAASILASEVTNPKAQGYIKGGSAVDTGAGQILAGHFTREADHTKADAQEHGLDAQNGIRALEQVEQNATEAYDMKKRTLDFMSSIQDTKAEANKALVAIRV